jgi:Fe-S cluster biogenesis protein NfuA
VDEHPHHADPATIVTATHNVRFMRGQCSQTCAQVPRRSAYTETMSQSTSITPETRERVEQVINLIRPAVQSDGGDVEFVDLTPEGTVKIRLHGACVGCPSSNITLKVGIERNLRAHVPEVQRIEAVG